MATEIGQDSKHVIAATHGKRAIDNLSQFKPHLKDHEIGEEVERFEESILFFADAYSLLGCGSERDTSLVSVDSSPETDVWSTPPSTPPLTPVDSSSSSSTSSETPSVPPRSGSLSFPRRLFNMLNIGARLRNSRKKDRPVNVFDSSLSDLVGKEIANDIVPIVPVEKVRQDALEAWQLEAAKVDRSVQILPGVRKLMDSIPEGRYAVATSGAKTYGKPWS